MATRKLPYRTPTLLPYIRRQVEKPGKVHPYTSVSNVQHFCPRAFYYAQRVDQDSVTRTVRRLSDIFNFSLGFWAEDFIEKVMKLGNVRVVAKEIEIFPDDEDLIGLVATKARIDFLIELNGKYYLVEVKKMNPRRFKMFKTRGLLTEEAAHYQLLYYLYNWDKTIKQQIKETGKANLPTIEAGILIGVTLEQGIDVIDTSVDLNLDDYEYFQPKLRLLQALKENPPEKDKDDFSPPNRPSGYSYSASVCKSCYFYQVCYDEPRFNLETDTLTREEKKRLDELIINISKASEERKNLQTIINVANDTLVGFIQSKEAHTLTYKSVLGELSATLRWTDELLFNETLVREEAPELANRATTIRKTLDLNKTIKLTPTVQSMILGQIKIVPQSLVAESDDENTENEIMDSDPADFDQ